MNPLAGILTIGLVLVLTLAQNDSVELFWATNIITETVWTLCSEMATTTIFEQVAFSTSLVLADAVLTGITVQPASSPTSCYNLPIPTSALDIIGFSTAQASTNTQIETDPVFFYVGDNATVPEYVATFIDGNRYLLDVSSNASAANRIALMLSSGESIVFDETGMHHFDAACDSGSSVIVNGFFDQIPGIVGQDPALARRRVKARRQMPETNFTVIVQVQDVIGKQMEGPQVSFGPSPCTSVERNDTEGWTYISWTCQHPGAKSDEKVCEQSFHSWLRPDDGAQLTAGVGDPGNPTNVNKNPSTNLLRFISKAGSSLATLFPALSPPLAKGLSWLTAAESAVLDVVEFGGESVCRVLHMHDEYFLVLSDPGISSVHTIGAYVSPPVPIISDTLASWTTRMTKEPPRVMIPGATEFSSVTATGFLPTALAGLGSILGGGGGGRVEDVSAPAITGPVIFEAGSESVGVFPESKTVTAAAV